MAAVILEPPKIKSVTVSIISPSICHEVMGPDAMILVFWMLSFKPTFSLSSFTFIKRLFSSSSLSAIRVVSPAYLRLLILLPAILIPACASSSLTFCMTYSAYKLNKQGDNIQPWCTPFPIWNQVTQHPIAIPIAIILDLLATFASVTIPSFQQHSPSLSYLTGCYFFLHREPSVPGLSMWIPFLALLSS